MKKAVIVTGGKQYLVTEGETLEVELLKEEGSIATFKALLVINGDKTTVGTPEVPKITVTADIVEPDVQTDKVTAIRYKAKKRVHKIRGHRQRKTFIRVVSIT